MSSNTSIRGWIECDDEQVEQIKTVVALHGGTPYAQGWSFPSAKASGSWLNFIFFGAATNQDISNWLEPQLAEIAAITPKSPDEHVRGLFFVSSEAHGRSEWLLKDGHLQKTATTNKYNFLDA